MTLGQGVETLKDLEQRQPTSWRLGVAALILGGVTLLLSEAGTLPRLSREMRGLLITSLILLAPVVGPRGLWNDAEGRLPPRWRVAGFRLLLGWLHIAGIPA